MAFSISLVLLRDVRDDRGADAPAMIALPASLASDPLNDGHEVSLARALGDAELPLIRPHGVLANDGNVGRVWEAESRVNGRTRRQVALWYPEADIQVTVGPTPVTSPRTYVARLVADWQMSPEVVRTVAGRPALAFAAGSDTTGRNPGSVALIRDGLSVVLYGYRSVDELMAVARTLSP